VARGKVLSAEDLEKLGGFGRYKDVDGDGVGYRTLPATNHPAAAYFTRGSGHNDKAQYTEREDDYVNNMNRLSHKFENIRKKLPKPQILGRDGAKIGIIAVGTSDWAVRESQDQMQNEYGIAVDYMRVLAYPFADEVVTFIREHERVYVVDQNRDGQLHWLLKLDMEAADIAHLRSVRYYGGLPLDARTLTDNITRQEGK
jgi:2-oxoglutarate ferredoxin oxidoreductase subunit alpha